jgi:hypothetical protein
MKFFGVLRECPARMDSTEIRFWALSQKSVVERLEAPHWTGDTALSNWDLDATALDPSLAARVGQGKATGDNR